MSVDAALGPSRSEGLNEAFAFLGDRWFRAQARLEAYRFSEGHHEASAPMAVAQPSTREEVQRIMRVASEARVPVVPAGARTSLEGNCLAASNAVILDLSLLNRILNVAADDLLCVVEPAVTRLQLERELRSTGLFFPVDPGADASIGGMLSTRASGTTSVRYGTMSDNVLGLQVVLPDGELIRTGTWARKSAAGYDLTHLFTGAEGTLGVIVEATLRLHGRPEAVLAGYWPFPSVAEAAAVVIAAMQTGVPVARLELLDEVAVRACNSFAQLHLPEQPLLFVELHGSPSALREQRAWLEELGQTHGAGTMTMSFDPAAQQELWRARHSALYAARALKPGAVVWTTDVCVPVSRLGDVVAHTRAVIDRAGLLAPIVGHVGDGNFHVFFVLDPQDSEAWRLARHVNEEMIEAALASGGTCTGEHGIGIGKQDALRREQGDGAISVMRRIKRALDPKDIMNPGKIFA